MISHKHKYIFVHIPKTGGTSIEKALLANECIQLNTSSSYPLFSLSPMVRNKFKLGTRSCQHWPLAVFNEQKQKNYFCFAVVRNPWAVMGSEYKYNKKHQTKKFRKNGYRNFKEFVRNPTGHRYHLKPQHTFINDNIDFVGRFEKLQEDFNKVMKMYGSAFHDVPIELPKVNKTNHKPYWEEYDSESRDIVAKCYAKDIDCFGYKFGK